MRRDYTVDSMMEIFYEEALSLINELRGIMEKYKECQSYNGEYIKKVFRVIHTMKADSTMMLLDTIAVPSRMLESLLVFLRNNKLEITDKENFDKILDLYVSYISDDVDEFSRNSKLENRHKDLENGIKTYLEGLREKYKDTIQEDSPQPVKEETAGRRQRQVYYIAGTGSTENQDKKQQTEKPSQKPVKDNNAVILVKQGDIERIYKSVKHYNNFVENIEERFGGDRNIEIRHRDLMMLKNLGHELSSAAKHLTKSDFVAIAQKMEIIVDEMSEALKKPVKLIVRGENTLVDKSVREKISSALVHVIRNAVDHGIEDMDERERLGKAPVGLVRLNFKEDNGHLVISVEDDGAGIDKPAVLKSAKERGLLKKPAEEYSDDEITNLLFASGVSTTEKPNDYSGRGVGMDVIHHNILSIGGKLRITSNTGYGTKVVMTI